MAPLELWRGSSSALPPNGAEVVCPRRVDGRARPDGVGGRQRVPRGEACWTWPGTAPRRFSRLLFCCFKRGLVKLRATERCSVHHRTAHGNERERERACWELPEQPTWPRVQGFKLPELSRPSGEHPALDRERRCQERQILRLKSCEEGWESRACRPCRTRPQVRGAPLDDPKAIALTGLTVLCLARAPPVPPPLLFPPCPAPSEELPAAWEAALGSSGREKHRKEGCQRAAGQPRPPLR